MFKAVAVALILALSGLAANAADIFSGLKGTVYVRGPIEDDDYSKFLAASGGQNLTVDLNSPGGSLLSALQMGAYVRDNGYSTLVRDELTCASACALLLARRPEQGSRSKGCHRVSRGERERFGSVGWQRGGRSLPVAAWFVARCRRQTNPLVTGRHVLAEA